MKNLLDETVKELNYWSKTPEDVKWVGSMNGEYVATWQEFALLANFNYDSGYGAQEIANDLVIVGNQWWLERHEYDGSEWWEYKTMFFPQKEEKQKKLEIVSGHPVGKVGWNSLKELHDELAQPTD